MRGDDRQGGLVGQEIFAASVEGQPGAYYGQSAVP